MELPPISPDATSLDLSGRNLTSLPAEITRLTNVKMNKPDIVVAQLRGGRRFELRLERRLQDDRKERRFLPRMSEDLNSQSPPPISPRPSDESFLKLMIEWYKRLPLLRGER